MVNAETLHFLRPYRARRAPTTFLMGLAGFDPVTGVHDSEKVTIDLMREDESISIAMPDGSGGYRDVTSEKFTNKEFTPPAFAESHSLNGFDLRQRQFGQNPFDDVDIRRNAAEQAGRNVVTIRNRMTRAIEKMMADVLQTGVITLINASGATLYSIDFGMKATHLPTVGTAWSNPAADAIGDLLSLAEVIRSDGLADADNVIMGGTAFTEFMANTAVKEQLNFRRAEVIAVRPSIRGNGATFQGSVDIGDFSFNIWTYSGRYKHPQTGTVTKYVDDGKVIMFASGDARDGSLSTQIDLTYGRYRPLFDPLPDVRRFIPGSIGSAAEMINLDINAWKEPNGMSLTVGAGSRPLIIPTGIDTFGCITT